MATSPSFQRLYHNIVFITLLLLIGSCSDCNNKKIKGPITQEASKNSERMPPIEETYKIGKPVKNQGIPNIGNSCYMNSVLQILASFYREIFSHSKEKELELAKAANKLIEDIT
ncbi:hypothetical protein GR268_43545, partial [Rhizobium leguminosarum]|nr:hypothetical protein [Rhizobium leguminosarum]